MASSLVLTLVLVACSSALGHPSLGEQPSRNSIEESADYTDCLSKGSVSCVKYKIFSLVDKVLANRESFTFAEGISLVKNPAAVSGDGAPRSLSAEDVQKEDFDSLIGSRVEKFLSSHTLKLDIKGKDVVDAVTSAGRALGDAADSFGLTDADETGDNGETGRKKGKKVGKMILPLLMMMKMKMAALIPIALGVIALIAGKALLIGKIALVLSAIIALKKLLSQQHKQVTYEIVSHPHHVSSHDHGGHGGGDWSSGGGDVGGGSGGWGRSAADMAYSAYKPQAPAS